ncbi:MAG: aldo/keto reductase [bacterium]|nr:aldo/keto reductase [bacterium]
MLYKPYGQTGKDVSVIGFGGMRFDNPNDIESNAEIVMHAHNKGINYFDTAPIYCNDKSEAIMGAALKQLNRDEFYVSTKSAEASGKMLRSQLDRSLERLNVDYIDFYHIWCIVRPEAWQERLEGGAVAEAMKAKDEGLIKHLVVSSHLQGDQLGEMLSDSPFEGVTLGYCAINFPYRQTGVDAAGKMGLGVVTMNPLAGGLIPGNPETFDFIRSEADESVVQAALRFNISQPAITSALVGFTTTEHIDQACDAVENFQPYSAEHIASIQERIIESFDGMCTGCEYCLPCPEGIEIPKFMDSYNQMLLSGGDSLLLLDRLKWHWNLTGEPAGTCTRCGACMERCTQHLNICDRLEEIDRIYAKETKSD